MQLHDRFNHGGFSKFINSGVGRVIRVLVGLCFLAGGYFYRDNVWGVVSMVWSIFPLTAGVFDWCFVSVILGGPLSGAKIRDIQSTEPKFLQ